MPERVPTAQPPTDAAPTIPARDAPNACPARIRIEDVRPRIDGGRHPVKRCLGDVLDVSADIFRDGHERLRAVVCCRPPGAVHPTEAPMRPIDAHLDGDRWEGSFAVDACGRWSFSIEAWSDAFASWREEIARKVQAGQSDLDSELSEGALLLQGARERAAGADRRLVDHALAILRGRDAPVEAKLDAALGDELFAATERHPDRRDRTRSGGELEVDVARVRARFGSWYELFPRSWGGLRGVTDQVPELARLGFDVIYLPPVHPIGVTSRKGRNNALRAAPDDPGSPWAIGSAAGGHEALAPELGTLEDFHALVATARAHELEIALDFAIQCSADHPWLTEHPEWFHRRPDGTLKYAENPPKRYQDIYNVNWDSEDWRGLWRALRDVVVHWIDHGVRIFRVDNPHTKPLAFWKWLIDGVHAEHPDVIFLAEAFTRQKVMEALAKVGFDQSYTYFTWKNARWEITQYVSELAYGGSQEYLRPNFFANTPDILHAYLQHGGRPAFAARLVLAATLSPTYGIYSGFERCENVALREGSEEYLHSEKYEVKDRALDGELLPMIARVNAIRRENPALQHLGNITFLDTENDALCAYAKRETANTLLVVVNLDPHHPQEGLAVIPAALGLPPAFTVHDLLTDARYDWRIGRNYVRLVPGAQQAHILRVQAP